MNDALQQLAASLGLSEREPLRLAFGHACVQRVRHLLEDPAVVACLEVLGRHVAGNASRDELERAAADAAALANHHPGSRSLDGVGHAAVSATYAVANALAGRALQAADYAAYASVYGAGGYGAVAERSAFEPEFGWQCDRLQALARGA